MNKKIILLLLSMFCLTLALHSQNVSVSLKPDASQQNAPVVKTMERNLSALLTEINRAYEKDAPLNLQFMPMSDFAKDGLLMLWENAALYCDEPYIVDRLWNFEKSYMVRHIPVLLRTHDLDDTTLKYQEVVVEFSPDGTISDFLFSSDLQMSESMEHGGNAVDLDRRMVILAYCDRFRTAYNKKDTSFLSKVFSEDALVITGSVVTSKRYDGIPITSIKYKKQNKEQYLANLKKCFRANQWINVKFYEIGVRGERTELPCVTQSTENPNLYGVRLRQEWNSSTYSDSGYIFLLWDFSNENAPVIHVRTWQPAIAGGQPLPEEEIFSLSDFENH